jgi:hypothetical protein
MANPVSPLSLTALFRITVSSQPQRRRRPVVAPNSAPVFEWVADVVKQFRWKWAGTHAGGIGLDNADHTVDILGAHAAAAAGIARTVLEEVTKG